MQVQKWGKRLAVRLPKSLCQAVNFLEGKEVEFTIEKMLLS
ncbi:AbrB/MazE/SpoVT family DNA-binding domain-containing protein [Schinkia azotoformans]|nr:AbrB/MazE/SpoVT family DNA-binding domain-containing protein [Schinkia azotoformans]MEC1716523.1 AbrB/MazE/SpoVT family DNA-binding domain-containing protein [Schinkia azotoformans]MEC1745643.1 AbrB/MazE/SpoVT family DNA-binding domain-containing protein [Schinkia azotoformans]MEC1760627.1 AbrB/MazE/SpoVT family DNA-binding domain-containing protein [Schinkia azotoformans]MED4378252.1 AbrB/MazE/SpoVT family DNA-binding domain-containing protein [Schinkia azotoformans]